MNFISFIIENFLYVLTTALLAIIIGQGYYIHTLHNKQISIPVATGINTPVVTTLSIPEQKDVSVAQAIPEIVQLPAVVIKSRPKIHKKVQLAKIEKCSVISDIIEIVRPVNHDPILDFKINHARVTETIKAVCS